MGIRIRFSMIIYLGLLARRSLEPKRILLFSRLNQREDLIDLFFIIL